VKTSENETLKVHQKNPSKGVALSLPDSDTILTFDHEYWCCLYKHQDKMFVSHGPDALGSTTLVSQKDTKYYSLKEVSKLVDLIVCKNSRRADNTEEVWETERHLKLCCYWKKYN